MRKSRILAVMLLLVLSLSACSGSTSDDETTAKSGDETNTEEVKVADGTSVIDIFAGLDVQFGGSYDPYNMLSGNATVIDSYKLEEECFDIDKVDYDTTNSDVRDFLKDIEFIWEEKDELDGCLKNGDVIHISLSYSKSTAEDLGISVLEESKEYVVSGLVEPYHNESEVDEAVLDKVMEMAEEFDIEEHWDVNWYIESEKYTNFTCSTSNRTFYEYDVDGNGEEYIARLIVMYLLDWASPYEDEGSSSDGTTLIGQAVTILVYEFDSSDREYTADYNLSWKNPDKYKDYSVIDLYEMNSYYKSDFAEGYKISEDGSLINIYFEDAGQYIEEFDY